MPALQLADTPMHSSPHYSHFTLHHQAFHASSPLSSPTGPISAYFDTPSTSSIVARSDEDRPPDLGYMALRFGDIPANSFAAGARSGLMQGPADDLQLLRGSSVTAPVDSSCSSKGEVKLLNRSQSNLGKRSTSPSRAIGKEVEALGNDGVAAAHTEAPCCVAGASGLCSSANCMVGSPGLPEAFLALQKFLPSNNLVDDEDDDEEIWSGADSWPALDVYSCDDFRMFEFKVRKCVRGRSHDWTECPFAHPGEKARRRDPRRYRYSGTACPDFRKGNCRRGEACEYSHGVFECWLHPTRYRTQPCKDGKGCRRRVCFFAHTPEQLRVVPAEGESPPTTPGSGSSSGGSARSSLLKAAALSGGAYDGSPLRRALAGTLDGTAALELFLDDAGNKGAPGAGACHHHHHHHWIGMGSSPSSTLVGLSAGATSATPMSPPVLSPASPLVSSGVPAHRRHLDRLRSIPTLSIPAADDPTGSPPQGSPSTMAELMSTLQTLQISPSAMTVQSCRTLPSASSAWPLLSKVQQVPSQLSAPNTPKLRYGHPMNMVQINASELSPYVMKPAPAVMAGSSSIATTILAPTTARSEVLPGVVESEVPDLGWVNELVQ